MDEEWRDIPGYNGGYQVSSLGRVRSWSKIKLGAPMTPNPVRGGQLMLRLVAPDGSRQFRSVHSLVAEAFIGPRPEGAVIRHLDDDPANNRVDNLRYGTHSENQNDAVTNGRNHQSSKTRCKNGHPLLGDNLYTRPDGSGRACKRCRYLATLRYKSKRRDSKD